MVVLENKDRKMKQEENIRVSRSKIRQYLENHKGNIEQMIKEKRKIPETLLQVWHTYKAILEDLLEGKFDE